MNNRLLSYVYVCLLLFYGCKGSEGTTTTDIPDLRDKAVVKKVMDRQVQFETLQAKTKIAFTTPEDNTSFKGDLRIQRDSAIWMSVKPALGLEVARVLITPDTIKLIDRINKKYLIEPFSYLERVYRAPLSFSTLQSLLTGGLMDTRIKDWEVEIVDNQYALVHESDSLRNNVRVNPVTFTITSMLVKDLYRDRAMQIRYEDYQTVDGQLFSHNRYAVAETTVRYTLGLEFSRVTFNRPLHFTFAVSDSYERL